jgi:hypothetical protein
MTITIDAPVAAVAPAAVPVVYLVAWTGGWDDPSFASFTDETKAIAEFEAWVKSARDRTDRITLVEQVINAEGVVINTKVRDHSPGWETDPDNED